MKSRIFDIIQIDNGSCIPKYIQLANSILNGLQVGKIKKWDSLPSINELTYNCDISRVTVEKGYKYLRDKGVLEAIQGKGYYISNTDDVEKPRILLLFNKLSQHKKLIYDAFVHSLNEQAYVHLCIYNSDYYTFKKAILNNTEQYAYFVIIPQFYMGENMATSVINCIPEEKLILLDRKLEGVKGEYGAVYENYRQNIYTALQEAKERLNKYRRIKIIFPEHTYLPDDIVKGFVQFCKEEGFASEVVPRLDKDCMQAGDVYISLFDEDLGDIIECTRKMNLKAGSDIGIISYNENALKQYILDGITTISTDFELMGKVAAESILQHTLTHKEIPFRLRLRNSL